MLQRILDYLRAHDVAGVPEIARAVDSTPDAVRSMLQTLQRKGRVHRSVPPQGCGTQCRQCTQVEIELYRLGRPMEAAPVGTNCAVRPLHQGPR